MSDDGRADDEQDSDDEGHSTEERSSSLPECPCCGRLVATITTRGPDTGTVGPCGCSVTPDQIIAQRRRRQQEEE
ncbi:hypothetical protein [Natrinema caseinilyticum]|uniref:hypothetical protein n=1 Tax=Natrinema caseinilyticum TaxID=2961570 RepID=UPI0020C29C56|nr:hypothetical protein [Natrinema caseinilyticum]